MSEALSPSARRARGKAARGRVPLDAHRHFEPAADRDPVALLLGQATTRIAELVPIRHGRMLASPFTFFRGAALPMAADLAGAPDSGLRVQLCGDAHLANFGAFASPERRLVFDINDFDETLPGPFEWDVKRLAASLAIAARDNGFGTAECRSVTLAGVAAYREAINEFARMPLMQVWYTHLDVEAAVKKIAPHQDKSAAKTARKALAKARGRTSTQAVSKLTAIVNGQRRIVGDPPLITPIEDVFAHTEADEVIGQLGALLDEYGHTLQSHHQHLLRQFTLVHAAHKVVGVGSVGTRAWILLMEAEGGDEPLFLQAKQAQESVLARFCGEAEHDNQGQRVVHGQRLMQAVSDIFLGWQRTVGPDNVARDFYLRQLRDWKFSVAIERLDPAGLARYARLCGWTLARAHARAGDRIALSGYLGKSDRFDVALAQFAELYADQTEHDHAALAAAVAEGRAQAELPV